MILLNIFNFLFSIIYKKKYKTFHGEKVYTANTVERLLIEFAKKHTELALKEAYENAEAIVGCDSGLTGSAASVDKDSILNAYPPLYNMKTNSIKEQVINYLKDVAIEKTPTQIGLFLGKKYNSASSSVTPALKALVKDNIVKLNKKGNVALYSWISNIV